jgi:Mrp family chromosome partitioning ATPase
MALLRKRLQEYEQQAKELAVDVTGVRTSDLEDLEKKVKSAEGRLQLVNQQMDNMRELEQCRINEFSISTPASMETVESKSNKRKLFVLVLFALSAILCTPVLAVEWLLQRESPVARFASRWGLPVIAERLLSNYSPTSRKPADWRVDDAIRMTTLRIQQSLGQSGGIVLMSGLGNTPTPVSLMSAIAECLAQREERVLLVDAIDPSTGSSLLSAPAATAQGRASPRLLPVEKQTPANGKGNSQLQKVFGLSEYLSRECEGVADLIQPTACPGVDLISSGANRFPNEAMASSCITELFDHCRSTYTMILVAGPPVVDRADFQMLAARADAILLAADRASIGDPINRAVVQDLIELRAPVIGIVA